MTNNTFLLPFSQKCPSCDDASEHPVCGSDHTTYKSLCELKAAACRQKKAIIVLKNGGCGGDDPLDIVIG